MGRLWRIFKNSAVEEWRYIRQNKVDQAMLAWVPLGAILMVWWVFSSAQIYNIPIGVYDRDASALSRQLTRYLQAAPSLQVVEQYHSRLEADDALREVDVYGVVEIPDKFSRDLKVGDAAPVSLYVNAQFGTHSGIVQRDVRAVVGTFSAGVEYKLRRKRGQNADQAMANINPIGRSLSNLFNSSTNYQQFLASAVIPALLHMLTMIAGAYTIGRELRDHTLLSWYQTVSGDRSAQQASFFALAFALNGRLLWPMLVFSLWGALSLWLMIQTVQVDWLSCAAVFFGLWLMSLLSFWFGVLVTSFQLSLRMGLSSVGIISAPALAFSGVTFPLSSMPDAAGKWAEFMPLTHYLRLQISQLQMSVPASYAIEPLLWMSVAVLVSLLLSTMAVSRAIRLPHRWGAR